MGYSEVISYNSAAALSFDNTLVKISGGALTLVGPAYTLTNPRVTSQHENTITTLSSFAEVSTLPANTAIQYQLVLNGVAHWYSAVLANWTTSDGTFAQSNTAAIINTNASTLISGLGLLTNQFLGLNIFLSTTNAANAPILTSNTIGYTWVNSNSSVINLVQVTGYLADLIGGNPVPTVAKPVQLLVSCDRAFFHGNHLVEVFTKSFSFDNTVYLSASIMETATPGVKLNFSVTYYDGFSLRTVRLFHAIVPNSPNINLSNLSSVYPYDFG